MKKKKGPRGHHARQGGGGAQVKNGAHALISDLEDLRVTARPGRDGPSVSSPPSDRLNGNCNGAGHAPDPPPAREDAAESGPLSDAVPPPTPPSGRPSSPEASSQSQSGIASTPSRRSFSALKFKISFSDQNPATSSPPTIEREEAGPTVEAAAEAADEEGDMSTAPISYLVYESELQMPDIMRLIQKDLSEPYSIYTYRYFIHNWPHLCFMVIRQRDDRSIELAPRAFS